VSQPDAAEAPRNPPAETGTWAPPGAAPFGPPSGSTPPAGSYAPPRGYAPPAGFPAASAVSVPAPHGPRASSAAPARRGKAVGVVALVLAITATVGAGVIAGIASFRIGLGAGREISSRPFTGDFDWTVLTPVRDWVLLGEVSFWAATALGVWALVQGIIAIVTARGRGAGIAAVIIAALGPVGFALMVQGFLSAGLASGTGIGG